jgi:ElaB/YqjD/DUF883 family membrane-anchored ribosome-binding protein
VADIKNQTTNRGAVKKDVNRAAESISEETDDAIESASTFYERSREEMNNALARLRNELDQLDIETARSRTREWIRENPALAMVLLAGAGLFVGRLIGSAFAQPPPPTFRERTRMRAESLADDAGKYARDLGKLAAKNATVVGAAVASQASRSADELSHTARDFGEAIAERAAEMARMASERTADLSEIVADRADDLGKAARKRAERTGKVVSKQSERAAKEMRRQARSAQKAAGAQTARGLRAADALIGATKAAVGVVAIKRLNDWIRR